MLSGRRFSLSLSVWGLFSWPSTRCTQEDLAYAARVHNKLRTLARRRISAGRLILRFDGTALSCQTLNSITPSDVFFSNVCLFFLLFSIINFLGFFSLFFFFIIPVVFFFLLFFFFGVYYYVYIYITSFVIFYFCGLI